MADPGEAVDFLRLVAEAESTNRQEALEDLKFRLGDQWAAEMQNSRNLESRPMLTINETDSYCRQVTNQIRQQRPRIKVHPLNQLANDRTAEVITGITRHIEVNSDADNAYDMAADYAVTMGFGYWRVTPNYIREDSFDQDIYIQSIPNPFSVYFDPNSVLPDGSDSERCLITDLMDRKVFEKAYPDAQSSGFNERSTGDSMVEWVNKNDIRLAEYFYVSKIKHKLLLLSNQTTVWEDQLPPEDILEAAGLKVIQERESYRRVVKWCKQTAFDILEEKTWPGRYIPVVPVYGQEFVVDGKRKRYGLVRFARDPQKMINFWQTNITETLAMAPKPKWLMAEGQDEGHENEFAQANISAKAVLRYKPTDVTGKDMPAPQRIAPEPPPQGAMEGAMLSSQNLQRVIGMFDPAIRGQQTKSGKALNAEQQQSDMSNFQFYDNLTRSIKHTGRIILDLTPTIYDQQRVMRVIGADGKPDLVTINERAEVGKVLNDVTVGVYDVMMDTGPGYNSKRQEALGAFNQLLGTPLGEEIAKVGADLVVRLYDAPGMEALADRLAAANPLAQIDDKSEIPPKAQIVIKSLQQALQQATQQIQALGLEIKYKTGIEQGWMNTELRKAHLAATVKAHDTETWAAQDLEDSRIKMATKRHDTETRALTAQNVEEIRGLVELLKHKLDTANFDKEIALKDREQQRQAQTEEPIQ